LIIRDQDLINPDAQPVQTDSMPAPQVLRDAEGDILNSGTGSGKPAKDLSLNFVPVPFPDYRPAVITMNAGTRELWRVLNASAITYLDLQVLFNDKPQFVGVAAIDGVPVNSNGGKESVIWRGHVLVPPAGRVEFIVKSPAEKVRAMFVTRTVDTGPAGENDPTRPLAEITVSATGGNGNDTSKGSGNRGSNTPISSSAPPARTSPIMALSEISPVRRRKLYFSERPQDSRDPKSPTIFTLTVDGQEPLPFDPARATTPNLVVQQGGVEDWIIENRTTELHDFHIHQLHFQLLEWNGVPVSEPFLRDTINIAYWDGRSPVYPSVRVRMDFRNPSIVGTFVYHCHLLEHEDGGMMGIVRVDPATGSAASSKR
jgi:FtsP/CotA-like multicopper oxidase with cupredoxin domain